jgi:hypothetical protein
VASAVGKSKNVTARPTPSHVSSRAQAETAFSAQLRLLSYGEKLLVTVRSVLSSSSPSSVPSIFNKLKRLVIVGAFLVGGGTFSFFCACSFLGQGAAHSSAYHSILIPL